MTLTRTEICAAGALDLVQSALRHARANHWEICAAVCDPRGSLVALLRTDDVIVPAVDFAVDKAYTAATLRRSTESFFARAAASPSLSLGLGNRPRLMVWSAGLPVFHDGVCIAGLGVSGAKDHEDVACAEAAIRGAGFCTEAG